MIGSIREVTQRGLAEQALRERQEQLRVALAAGRMGTWVCDSKTRLVRIDAWQREIWDLEGDAAWVPERVILGRIHPEDRGKVLPSERLAQISGPIDLEFRILRRNGEVRWLRGAAAPVRDGSGAVSQVVGVNFDVTEQKQVEQARRESEQRYQTLVDLLPDPVAVHRAGKYRFMNRAALALFGIAKLEELGDRGVLDLVHPEDRSAAGDRIRGILEGEAEPPPLRDMRVLRLNGEAVWVESTGTTITYEGQPAVLVVLRHIGKRKAVEAALRLSEQKFTTAFAQNPAAITLTRLEDGLFLEVNDRWVALLGYHREEALGALASQLPIWPTPEARARFVAELRANGALRGWEQELRKKSGERFFVQLSAQILTLQGETVVLSTLVDITERKRAEAALRLSDEQLKRAQSIAHLGSWDLDLVHNRLTWSDEVYRIFGLEPQQFGATYEAFLERVYPEDRAAVDAAYSGSLRESRDTYEIEHRVVRQDTGEMRIVHEKCEHFRDAEGRIIRSMGMVHDITEPKRAQEAREQLAQQRQLALDAARMGWWHYDLKTRHLVGDKRCGELLELADAPLTPETLSRLIHPEDMPNVSAAMRGARNSKDPRPCSVEFRIGGAGSWRWLEAHGIATFEGTGESRHPTSLVGTVQDITERKAFQAELQRLVEERTAKLKELVGELEHFSYTITHDMRAPLRGMQGFAEMMAEACEGCERQKPEEFLRRIQTSGSRMDALITDALQYAKAVRNELPLAPVEVGALLRGMLDSYPELQPERAHIQVAGDLPPVMGNEAGLTQVFSNLLGNAVKFVTPGQAPEVRIWAEQVPGPTSPTGPTHPTAPSMVRIWVEDNGIGIPQSMKARVFDMFSRGHSTYQGTGIGLALVRKVVERMGGKAGVESKEGRGSRFWVELKPGEARVRP